MRFRSWQQRFADQAGKFFCKDIRGKIKFPLGPKHKHTNTDF